MESRAKLSGRWVAVIILASYAILYVSLEPRSTRKGEQRTLGLPNASTAVDKAHLPLTQYGPALRRESRPLELFRDVIVDEYHSRGSINVACYVKLPNWWYRDNLIPNTQKFLMKMTTDLGYAAKEIDALRKISMHEQEARRLKLPWLVAGSSNTSNPFYCRGYDQEDSNSCQATQTFPKTFPLKVQERLRAKPYLAAFVVPFLKGQGYVYDEVKTPPALQRFMKSILGQLALTHSVGINNLDLSGDRNILVDSDGDAVLFDWNGAIAMGEKLYNSEHSFSIIPPEAWIEEVEGHEIKMMSVSAFDVWSVGIMFARILFYPCRWASHTTYERTKDRLQATILALGGNTVVPVDEGVSVDFAEFAGMNQTIKTNTDFIPHLVGKHKKESCPESSFEFLSSLSENERVQALDLLGSMMKISPLDRPGCNALLKHPFLSSV